MMNWVLGFICVWVLLHVVRINGRESSSLRCLTSICTPQVCQPGEKLQKDINDCCPVCKPSRPAYCQFVRCAVPVCENGKLHTPVGQCCPVCEQGCLYKSKTYKQASSFRDDCNTCLCNKGVVSCTKTLCQPKEKHGTCPATQSDTGVCVDRCNSDYSCPGQQKCCKVGCGRQCWEQKTVCSFKNTTYQIGESFTDDCNRCNCLNGQVVCTRMRCLPTTKPGVCPPDNSTTRTKPCVVQCLNDASCSGTLKCCRSGCGRSCMEPLASTGIDQCYKNGKSYLNGQPVPPDNDVCLSCYCRSGKITCKAMQCPVLKCTGALYRIPGICCQVCRPFTMTS